MKQPIISLENFSYIYPNSENKALDDVTLNINPGEFIGIVGGNRAGKSTLCQAMVGVIPNLIGGRWSGDVKVNGISISGEENTNATDIIGIVFQDAESQFTQETVEDEVAFALCNYGYEKSDMLERVEEATRACDVFEMLDRSPFRLSGGQQQRVAIASILALRPDVIILDESTSQLDPIGRDEVFALVKNLHETGRTIIMVDHNIEKIAEYADKIIVLHEGKLIEFGDAMEVFNKREHLNKHNVRVPQVTEASLELGRTYDKNLAPISLEGSKELFEDLRKQGANK